MRAIVMGRNYASLLGMIRAAGHCGCEVVVIRSVSKKQMAKSVKQRVRSLIYGRPAESASKYVIKYLNTVEPDRKMLLSLLKQEKKDYPDKIILLPTDDYTASTIDMYYDKLRCDFLMPNVKDKQGAVVEAMDKEFQKQLADQFGLPTADGWTIQIKGGKFELPADLTYPCFPKPQVSFMGNKNCMQRCDDEKALTKIVKQVAANSDCPLLIEQFINIEKEYGMLGFCDGTKAYIPAMIHKIAIGNGAHKGVTLLGKVIPSEQFKYVAEKICAMVESIGFTGLFDVDLYEMDGKIYFNELNMRLGAFGYAVFCTGINLPAMLIKKLSGKPYEDEKKAIDNTIICLNDKVNIEDFAARYISWEQYLEVIRKADYRFITDKDDPGPEKAYNRLERIIRLKRLLKK